MYQHNGYWCGIFILILIWLIFTRADQYIHTLSVCWRELGEWGNEFDLICKSQNSKMKKLLCNVIGIQNFNINKKLAWTSNIDTLIFYENKSIKKISKVCTHGYFSDLYSSLLNSHIFASCTNIMSCNSWCILNGDFENTFGTGFLLIVIHE